MVTGPAPLPLVAVSDTRCRSRVEVDSHLRTHGCTEQDLGRARPGVTR